MTNFFPGELRFGGRKKLNILIFELTASPSARTSELVRIQQELKEQQKQQQKLHRQRQQQLEDFHELKLKATPDQENQVNKFIAGRRL